MQGSVGYNLAFAAAVCLVCAVVVSSAAVSLADVMTQRGIRQPAEMVNWLSQLLLAVPLASLTREQLVAILQDKSKGDLSDRLTQAIYTMTALPEFHLN